MQKNLMNMNMANVRELSEHFETLEDIKKELKRIQSIKCRLKKQKSLKTYDDEMTKVVKYEQLLKEVRQFREPEKITVTRMTQEDVNILNYDETVKALKSIQSKKCNVQYLTENLEDNIEYQEALKIENMLKIHRNLVKPIEDTVVKKSEINELLSNLEDLKELDKDDVLQRLKDLLK